MAKHQGKKIDIKTGGKQGTVPPDQFPVDWNNDSSARFHPQGNKKKR